MENLFLRSLILLMSPKRLSKYFLFSSSFPSSIFEEISDFLFLSEYVLEDFLSGKNFSQHSSQQSHERFLFMYEKRIFLFP